MSVTITRLNTRAVFPFDIRGDCRLVAVGRTLLFGRLRFRRGSVQDLPHVLEAIVDPLLGRIATGHGKRSSQLDRTVHGHRHRRSGRCQ